MGTFPLLTYWGMTMLQTWNGPQTLGTLPGVHSLLDLLNWDPEELKAVPTQQVNHQDPKSPSKGMMDPSICHHKSISC